MKKNKSKPVNLERFARQSAIPYGTVRRWHATGAPIGDGPAAVLRWWRQTYDRGNPPAALMRAAVKDTAPRPKKPAAAPRTPTSSGRKPEAESAVDLEALAETQRRHFTRCQRELDAARAVGADDYELERLQGAVDRVSLTLCRVERLALANRPLDPRWVEIPRVREIFDRLHTGLNNRLFAIAEAHSPDPTALRAAWDAAVARIITDPFEAGAAAA